MTETADARNDRNAIRDEDVRLGIEGAHAKDMTGGKDERTEDEMGSMTLGRNKQMEKTATATTAKDAKAAFASSRGFAPMGKVFSHEATALAAAKTVRGGSTIRHARRRRFGSGNRYDYVTVDEATGETRLVTDLFANKAISESKRHWLHYCGYEYLAIPRDLPSSARRMCVAAFRMGQRRAEAMGIDRDEFAVMRREGLLRVRDAGVLSLGEKAPRFDLVITDERDRQVLLGILVCDGVDEAEAARSWCRADRMQALVFVRGELDAGQMTEVIDSYFQGLTGESLAK